MHRWCDGYVEQLFARDVTHYGLRRNSQLLRNYFEAICSNTAGIINDKSLYSAAGIDKDTARQYNAILEDLCLVQAVPAWHSNRLKRLIKTVKRYVVDPALVAGVVGIDQQTVMKDGNLLGRVIDSFVMAQLRPELALLDTSARVYHLRDEQGRHEVDIVIELGGNRIIAIEVKSSGGVKRDDARHLMWLRDHLGDSFVRGIVFHTGPFSLNLDDRIVALPISAFWS